MSQFASIEAFESRVGALVLPHTFQVSGWDDLTTKLITLTWYSLSGVLLFRLTEAADSVSVSASTFTLSPSTNPLQSSTAPTAGSGARYRTWDALPDGSYALEITIRDPGNDAEMGYAASWTHHPRYYVGNVSSSLGTVTTVDTLGQQVSVTVTVADVNAVQLQGVDVSATPPTNGQALVYNAGSGEWEASSTAGTGDVQGPASASDNAFARFNGTGGKTIQNSQTTEDDLGNVSVVGDVEVADGTKGLILKSPGGTRFRVSVDDNGFIKTSAI